MSKEQKSLSIEEWKDKLNKQICSDVDELLKEYRLPVPGKPQEIKEKVEALQKMQDIVNNIKLPDEQKKIAPKKKDWWLVVRWVGNICSAIISWLKWW